MPKSQNVQKNEKLIKALASGALWITGGMIIARILGYAVRAAISHFYGLENYGIINTALSMMMMVAIFALAGLNTGLPRQISFYKARDNWHLVYNYIRSALKFGFLFGLLGGALLYFSADFLAEHYFKNTSLSLFLKVFALGVPLFVLFELNTSVFKGLRQMSQFTFFHDVLRFSLILIFLLILGVFGYSFSLSGYCYIGSYIIIILICLFILRQRGLLKISIDGEPNIDKKLLLFSVPLMFSGIFWLVIPRMDTILIGGFLDQKAVGLYNAAVPIGQLLLIVRQAFTPIVLPLFTGIFATGKQHELSHLNFLTVKWSILFTLPLFIIVAFYPDFFLLTIFGKDFLAGAYLLRILIVGYFIHTIIGPTSNLLIIMGKTKLAMINAFIAFLISLTLNLILIPKIGLVGVAISSTFTYLAFNFLSFIQVYKSLKIQPFRLLHLKLVFSATICTPILFYGHYFPHIIISFLLYTILYGIILVATRSIKSEDLILFKRK